MNLLKVSLFILCFATCNNTFAQTEFSKRYSFNIPGDIFASLLIVHDSIFIVGVSGDTTHNNAEIQDSKNLSCIFDLKGNEIKHFVYNGSFRKSYETFVHSLIKIKYNGFALCGSTIDTSSYQALFMQYDSAMNPVVIKEFQYPDSILFMELQNMVQLNNGNYLIVGNIQNPLGIGSIILLKLDSAANTIWWKNYNPQYFSEIYPSIIQLTDTTLLIGCEHSNELQGPYSITSQTKFFTIDTAGNVLNQWMDSNDSTFAPYGLLKTNDGGYAYCGRYMIQMNAPYDAAVTAGVITKVDSAFNIKWRKIYSDPANIDVYVMLNQLRQLPDSSLVAAGAGVSWNTISQTYEPTGWFVKVSASGDNIWSRMYRGTPGYPLSYNTNVINDFQILPDGGMIGCGAADDAAATQFSQQAWLIRLDSMGCLIPGCDTLTATGLSPVPTNGSHTGVVVYPNPASNMAYLLIKTDNPDPQFSFLVYNANGKLLTEEKGAMPDVTYLLHVNSYASGMYYVQILSNGQVVANTKFIKE